MLLNLDVCLSEPLLLLSFYTRQCAAYCSKIHFLNSDTDFQSALVISTLSAVLHLIIGVGSNKVTHASNACPESHLQQWPKVEE